MTSESKIRVLITKVGLDGHDRGAKAITTLLREAGFEVVYLGRFQTPQSIVRAALQEDVDIIGVSCLCGEHFTFIPIILELLRENKREDLPIVIGGIIPRDDMPRLKEMGVAEVFTWGASSDEIARFIREEVRHGR